MTVAAATRFLRSSTAETIGSGATSYYLPASGFLLGSATEADRQIAYRTPGTITYLGAQKSAGNRTGMQAYVRIGGVTKTGLIPFTSTNGLYEDSSGSDAVSAGDLVGIAVDGGTGGTTSLSIRVLGGKWAATNDTTTHHAVGGSGVGSIASNTTTYRQPSGVNSPSTTVQANGEWKVRLPAGVDHITLKNLYVRVSANTSDTNTCTVSVNGATGTGTAPSVTIGLGAGAETKEDTTHAIQAKDGDLISIKIVRGTSGGTLTIETVSIEAQSDDGVWHLIAGRSSAVSLPTDARFLPLAGGIATFTDTSERMAADLKAVFSLLSAFVTIAGSGSAIKLEVNGSAAGSPAQLAVSTDSTGWRTDTANSYTSAATDQLAYRVSVATSGASVTCIAITVSPIVPDQGSAAEAFAVAASSAAGRQTFKATADTAFAVTAEDAAGLERSTGVGDTGFGVSATGGLAAERVSGSGAAAWRVTAVGAFETIGDVVMAFGVAAPAAAGVERFRGAVAEAFAVTPARQAFRGDAALALPVIAAAATGRNRFFAGRVTASVSVVGEITAQVRE